MSQTEIITKHHKERKIGEEIDEEEGDEVVFLYRIVPGKGPSASFGIWCAGVAGLPSTTIKRGNLFSNKCGNNASFTDSDFLLILLSN